VGLAQRVIRVGVLLVGLLLALEILDVTALVGAVLGAAGVMGVALGFAFRNIAENWLAGVLLSLRRPFEPDDDVSIGGNVGRVVRLTNSDTVLMTPSGNHLRIPNASVFNGVVENFTRNPLRRFTLRLTTPRDTSVAQARAALMGALGGTPGVIGDPPPVVLVVEVGDSHLSFDAHGWVDQHKADFTNTRGLAYRQAKEALEAEGIPGPFTEQTIYMGPEGSPGSAAYEAPAGPDAIDVVEVALPDATLERQVADDRARSGEADLLGGS